MMRINQNQDLKPTCRNRRTVKIKSMKKEVESDLEQRLVPGFSEPLDPPLGASAGTKPFNFDLTHPCDSLQSVL